jgi:hypothetical protein
MSGAALRLVRLPSELLIDLMLGGPCYLTGDLGVVSGLALADSSD